MTNEIMLLQESARLLRDGAIRAGNTERSRAAEYLRRAYDNGYLTEDQYNARITLCDNADTTIDLHLLLKDLPKPQKNSRDKSLTALEDFQENHVHAFHVAVMALLTVFVGACWIVPGALANHLYGGAGFSPILLIPILGTFMGVVGGIINGVYWAESA